MEQLRIVMTSKPLRVPSLDYAKTKNPRVCFLTHQLLTPLTELVQHDSDMTQAFADACGSALRSRRESLPHTRFIHLDLLYIETIHIDALGVLRIRYRRMQGLSDNARGALRNKLENIQGLFDSLAANLIHYEPYLARREPDILCDRFSFHGYSNFVRLPNRSESIQLLGAVGAAAGFGAVAAAAGLGAAVVVPGAGAPGVGATAPTVSLASPLRSPECTKKVRVGENSPSLWPTMFSVTNTGINFRPLWTPIV